MNPILLLWRSEADPDEVRREAVNFRDDGVLFGVFEVTVVRPDDLYLWI